MNERMRELVRESNLDVYGLGKERYRWEYTVEKFAELIVKECATIINDIPSAPQGSWSDGYYEGCTDSAKQIKQHFGVEE
jgi:hypothetical protein